ncbi:MAG: methyltransferase domain-containing protein [Devosia sp.]|nr:methyltransferase domain-containing protein [Devosia sp.]
MDFRQTIRNSVDLEQRGLEIGPAYAPILPKASGYRVLAIDHTDQGSLREKYRREGVDVGRIEQVDAIDDGGEFSRLDETGAGFDFIVASHVFEHLPNPIHFLQRCERALKPNGRLILIIPDRRFCFDLLRPVSTAGQMIEAYLGNRSTHSPAALFDHHAYNARRNGAHIWVEREPGSISLTGTPVAGYAAAVAANNGAYVDCHGWVFTSSSFRLAIEDLRSLGLIGLGEAAFCDTVGAEFMIELTRAAAATARDRLQLALTAQLEAQQITAIGPIQASASFDGYATAPAAPANAVRLLDPSWVAALPPELGIKAGEIPLYADGRIDWLVEQLRADWPSLDILELGPLEASHTGMMLKAGARSVLAIEGNRLAYLKCLVVKETLGLADAHFLLGDFVPFLQHDERHWPLIVASGVLYHMVQPLELLRALAKRTDRLFLWTHVYDPKAMPKGDPRHAFFTGTETVDFDGAHYRVHAHPYGVMAIPTFCGGPVQGPRWMEREDVFDALQRLGFDDIRISSEQPDHPSGPALSILAQRRAAAQAGY